jgi:hypothetical protein
LFNIPEFGFGPTSQNSHIVEIEENLYAVPVAFILQGLPQHFRCAIDIKGAAAKTLPV